MFEILTIVASLSVFTAVKMIIQERKRKQEANKKWRDFLDNHPKKSSSIFIKLNNVSSI